MVVNGVAETSQIGQALFVAEFQHLRAIGRFDGLLQHQQQLQHAGFAGTIRAEQARDGREPHFFYSLP